MFRGLAMLAGFLAGSLAGFAGLRLAQHRLQALLHRYSERLGSNVGRARLLDDVGPLGAVVGRLALAAQSALSGIAVITIAACGIILALFTGQLVLAYLTLGTLLAFPFVLSQLIDIVLRRRVSLIESAIPEATMLIASS